MLYKFILWINIRNCCRRIQRVTYNCGRVLNWKWANFNCFICSIGFFCINTRIGGLKNSYNYCCLWLRRSQYYSYFLTSWCKFCYVFDTVEILFREKVMNDRIGSLQYFVSCMLMLGYRSQGGKWDYDIFNVCSRRCTFSLINLKFLNIVQRLHVWF